jgi:hypothetical protein
MKKGLLVAAPEWWRHLKAFNKRRFWKRQRVADKDFVRVEAEGAYTARLDDYRTKFTAGNDGIHSDH